MRYAIIYWLTIWLLFFQVSVATDTTMIPTNPSSHWPVNGIQTGEASRYDYSLKWHWMWSKPHNTCAVRELPKYSTWKVCNLDNGKCVECYQNDYWPKEYTNRIIDLSSHSFAQIGNLRAWVMRVSIEKVFR